MSAVGTVCMKYGELNLCPFLLAYGHKLIAVLHTEKLSQYQESRRLI